MLKNVFDYTLTIIGTIAISPILLFIAVWIYKDSPGPVIFKHIRIGKGRQAVSLLQIPQYVCRCQGKAGRAFG